MALKATFTAGSDSTIVKGLYQWDYGQVLEIESADIGSEIFEVHFASSSMNEAIVRSCTFVNGVGSVILPDVCLEQSSTITAWIYQINGTQGHTIKTITMPITARIRPSINRDIPAEVSDKYTELITEVNEVVDALENGNITAAKAIDATNAAHATSAGNAGTANYAMQAECDKNGNSIPDTYATIADIEDGTIKAKTAKSADNADNATKLVGSVEKYTTGTNKVIQIALEAGKVYAITFQLMGGFTYETIVTYIPSFNGTIYSAKTYNGYYVKYVPNSGLQIMLGDTAASPNDIYVREI